MNTISACIISFNEEKNISNLLESINNDIDEIVLVDTGSTDKTIEIAKQYSKVKVFSYKWDNNFSNARNYSLSFASMDWILILDCDEVIPKGEILKIKDTLKNPLYEGYFLRVQNFNNNNIVLDVPICRLFKNKENYLFNGAIHEQIINSIIDSQGESFGFLDNNILHYGYSKTHSDFKNKISRNLNILISIEDSYRDYYYYYSLGNEYGKLKNIPEAIKYYEKCLILNTYDFHSKFVIPNAIINLLKSYSNLEEYENCILKSLEYETLFPNLRDIYFMQWLCYTKLEKGSLASQSLTKFLSSSNPNYEYPIYNYGNLEKIIKLNNLLNS